MNSITLVGRATADPDIRVANNEEQTTVAHFTLAVYRTKDTTDFINCVAFRETAELVEKYLTKGLRVAVNGSLNIDVVESKGGSRSYYTKVIARSVEICQSKTETSEKKDDDFVDPGDAKPPWEDNGGAKKNKNRR